MSSAVPSKASFDDTGDQAGKRASHIISETHHLIQQAQAVQDTIKRQSPSNAVFSNTLLPLARAENVLAMGSHPLVFHASASPDSNVRDASRQARRMMDDFLLHGLIDESLARLISAVVKKHEILSAEDARLLAMKHRHIKRHGLLVEPPAARERLHSIRDTISRNTSLFRSNLATSSESLWFTLSELHGVPDRFLRTLERGTGGNQNRFRVQFTTPHLTAIMRYAESSQIRKTMFIANETRCVDNLALFRDVVLLRDEAARLLGYSSHAEFQFAERMARIPETVVTFLDDLKERLQDLGVSEAGALRELKAEHTSSALEETEYYLWDHPYYNRLMTEQMHGVDQEKVAEYFPLPIVIRRMLLIFEDLFGLDFEDITSNAGISFDLPNHARPDVWDPKVKVFATFDADDAGKLLGFLYLDLYDRDGKTKGPANYNLIPGFVREDGTRQLPSTALLCSFPASTSESPCLLKHEEVVIVFHEIGHAIHNLVSKTTYACFHGTEVAVDFGEAPSQMLEHWCWTPSVLKFLSKHFTLMPADYDQVWTYTKEQVREDQFPSAARLPESMTASIIAARHVNAGHFHLNQLRLAMFDMAIHNPSDGNAIKHMDISVLYNELRSQLFPPRGPEAEVDHYRWGHGHVLFGHCMEEDYSAGYYSYLFSKAFAADMYESAFSQDPFDRAQGRQYRYTVLEKGGSRDGMDLLQDFLGRPPSSAAFYRCLSKSI